MSETLHITAGRLKEFIGDATNDLNREVIITDRIDGTEYPIVELVKETHENGKHVLLIKVER